MSPGHWSVRIPRLIDVDLVAGVCWRESVTNRFKDTRTIDRFVWYLATSRPRSFGSAEFVARDFSCHASFDFGSVALPGYSPETGGLEYVVECAMVSGIRGIATIGLRLVGAAGLCSRKIYTRGQGCCIAVRSEREIAVGSFSVCVYCGHVPSHVSCSRAFIKISSSVTFLSVASDLAAVLRAVCCPCLLRFRSEGRSYGCSGRLTAVFDDSL